MKKISMILVGVGTSTFIAPGIWKYVDDGGSGGKTWLVIQNNTPNQNVEDFGGYNAVDIDPYLIDFPDGFSVSAKQYLTFATEWGQTPPEGVLKNYRTAQECFDALDAGTDTQGVMLYDNI